MPEADIDEYKSYPDYVAFADRVRGATRLRVQQAREMLGDDLLCPNISWPELVDEYGTPDKVFDAFIVIWADKYGGDIDTIREAARADQG